MIDEENDVVHEDGEPRRVLGIPRLRSGVRPDECQPRVLGIPRDWFVIPRERPGSAAFDVRRVAHPMRWWRWRRQVHRLGPYAPDYDDGGAGPEQQIGNPVRGGNETDGRATVGS